MPTSIPDAILGYELEGTNFRISTDEYNELSKEEQSKFIPIKRGYSKDRAKRWEKLINPLVHKYRGRERK